MNVPAQFEPIFRKAQDYVKRYFANRVEDPEHSTITISGERYILPRAASMSVEFVDLVMSLYQDKGPAEARSVANNLLFDLAHAIGRADARSFHQKMKVEDPIERLSAGPIHFAFAGWAFVKIFPESQPSPDENYFLVYDHPFSFESNAWISRGRQSDVPVCVMNSGYSSGWCEESFGLPLVAAEVECMAAGGAHCRFVMAPPSRIEEHVSRFARTADRRTVVTVPEFFQRKRMEDELRRHQADLEKRVAERTAELLRANELLEHQALYDGLTSLPNRTLLLDRLEQALLASGRDRSTCALLFLDLDGFKEVNDTFGHHAGDQLLGQVGSRIRNALRATDSVSRLGGDEFAILLPTADTAGSTLGAQKILQSLEEPFIVEGQSLTISASMGIALSPEHGTQATTLMRRADVAMYVAKRSGSGFAVYDAQHDQHSSERLQFVEELRRGLEKGEIVVHYQPEVEIATRRVVRIEALARFPHPKLGLLPPDRFLPFIERPDGHRPGRADARARDRARPPVEGARRGHLRERQRAHAALGRDRRPPDDSPEEAARARSARSACASRWTTSGPARRRWPSSGACPSTSSRSTACSSRTWPGAPPTRRWSRE